MDIRKTLGERLIYSIEQIESHFDPKEPKSIITPYYSLPGLHIYYRRGDTKEAYEGNFIPVWVYLLFFEAVILFIRPDNTRKKFRDYCGLYPEQLLDFIEQGRLVPLIGDTLEQYKEEVFGEFFNKFPRERHLIRAQLWEDAYLRQDGAFRATVNARADNYLSLMDDKFESTNISEYEVEAKGNTLMPANIQKLAAFAAEKAEWHKIFGKEANVEKIEKTIVDSPLPSDTYQISHALHYFVASKIYSRGGFVGLARGEDRKISKYVPVFRAGLPSQSAVAGLKFKFPLQNDDLSVEESLNFLKEVQGHSKLGPLSLTIRDVMKRFQDVNEFHKQPMARRQENSMALREVFRDFNQELEGYLGKKKFEQLQPLKQFEIGAATSYPAVDELTRFLVDVPLEPGAMGIVVPMFSLVWGARNYPAMKMSASHILRTFKDLKEIPEKIEGELGNLIIELELDDEVQKAPFILTDYPNPS